MKDRQENIIVRDRCGSKEDILARIQKVVYKKKGIYRAVRKDL